MMLLERFRSPSGRAIRNAGPRDRDVAAGAILSAAVIAIAWLTGILQPVPWPAWMAIPVVILSAVAIVDADGWRIRRAMAYVAIEQRKRWTRGRIPATPSLAQRWLTDPSNADASSPERASALLMTGDVAAASAALDRFVPRDATEAAGMTRMRSVFRARETGVVDIDAVRAATEGLADGERRYQLTSAAFSQAWLDIEAGRPWRPGFAQAARTLGPHPVPLPVAVWIGVQELAAPIAVVVATAIMVGIVGG
jgi:hypothetical protein